jgi:DNA mismatch endonuclease (patch repair protein)
MADVFSKAKRSEVMARIRGRGNKDTELALARLLRAQGISGWRRQVEVRGEKVEGRTKAGRTSHLTPRPFRVRPDFVFRQARLAVFVDGCFWHGCPRHATQPKHNAAFWRKKLAGNKRRDALVTRTLRKAGWRVVRLWECALQQAVREERRQTRLLRPIQRALE